TPARASVQTGVESGGMDAGLHHGAVAPRCLVLRLWRKSVLAQAVGAPGILDADRSGGDLVSQPVSTRCADALLHGHRLFAGAGLELSTRSHSDNGADLHSRGVARPRGGSLCRIARDYRVSQNRT